MLVLVLVLVLALVLALALVSLLVYLPTDIMAASHGNSPLHVAMCLAQPSRVHNIGRRHGVK